MQNVRKIYKNQVFRRKTKYKRLNQKNRNKIFLVTKFIF